MKYALLALLLLSGCKTVEPQAKPPLPEGVLNVCAPLKQWPNKDLTLKEYYLLVSELDAQYADCAVRHNLLVKYLKQTQ